MNRVCRTEGHDYPTFAPQINGVPQIKGVSESSIITGPCRRCGLDALLDPAILSKRLAELAREFRQYRNLVADEITAVEDRLTALEANGPRVVVNDAAPATEAVRRELRAYVEQNVEVAESAPGVAVKR